MAVITGTNGNDDLVGTAGSDTISPLLGKDLVDGLGGSDTLVVDYSAASVDPYAGASIANAPSVVASSGGAFSGIVTTVDGGNKVTFAGIEHLDVKLDFFHNLFVLDGAALALGATIYLDGGAGTDTLEADLSALASVDLQSGGGGTVASFGTILGFEAFRLNLGAGADHVATGAGNDILTGNGGDDVLSGGAGNDVIKGGSGTNLLDGGEGDDWITSAGTDTVEGGSGFGYDRWTGDYGSSAASLVFVRDLAARTGSLSNGTTLSGIEQILALTTGSGDDHFTLAASEGITIAAGAGADTLNLTGSAFAGEISADGAGAFGGFLGYDRFTGIEYLNFVGGGVADTIAVNAAPLLAGATLSLDAGGGSDILALDLGAFGAITFVVAADGSLTTNVPATLLNFETYRITSGAGADNVVTGGGDDTIQANGGNDVIAAAAGNDLLDGGSGADSMSGGTGNDVYVVDDAGDTVAENSGEGLDEIRTGLAAFSLAGLANIENLRGTSATGQSLTGSGGANVITGGSGNDLIDGGAGADTLIGGAGDDSYVDYFADAEVATIVELAGGGTDEIRTGALAFSLATLANVENLTGTGASGQTLTGNSLANRIDGGAGRDLLDGAGGNDLLIGGADFDSARFVAPAGLSGSLELIPVGTSGEFDVELATGNFTQILFQVRLAGGAWTVTGVGNAAAMGVATLQGVERVEFRTASDPAVVVEQELGLPVFYGIAGTQGADVFAGTGGADRYHGYGGNDDISGQAGSDTLYGGAGNDQIRGGADRDFLYGGGGNDMLDGETGHDHLEGGEGDDLIVGGAGQDTLNGGAGSDTLQGGLDADNLFDSAGFYDRLFGEDGNDRITVTRAAGSSPSIVEIGGGAGWDDLTLNVANASVVFADMGSGDGYITLDRMEGVLTLVLGDGHDNLNLTATAADPLGRGSILVVGFDPSLDQLTWNNYLPAALTNLTAANPFATGHLRWRQSGTDGLLEIDRNGGGDSFSTLITFRDVTAANFTNIGNLSPVRIDEGDGTYTYVAGSEMTLLTAGSGDDVVNLAGWFVNVDAGAGDDRIYGGYLHSDFAIDGGAGNDELIIGLNPITPIGNLHNIETLSVHSGYAPWFGYTSGGPRTYWLTMLDSAVAAAALLRVDASGLAADEAFEIDASAETDGRYEVFGNAAGNAIRTGAGDDLLDGGAGADAMTGGAGNDIFYVDNAGDTVTENSGEGTDEVRTSLATYSLFGTNLENLTATSDAAHDFRGSSANNVLTGGGGNDFLRLQDGGVDTANGGGGSDVFLFGGSMTGADSVDGGSGTDQLVLQGDYWGANALTLGTGFLSVENFAILPGDDTRFGDPGTNFYDYSVTTRDVNVAAGVQLVVDANRLRAGEDFTFNGSAEIDGSFFIYGGGGTDLLTGGANNDVFLFGAQGQWGASDVVNGGSGGIDQLALRGNYTLTFGAGQLIGIENIGLLSAHDTRFGALGSSYSYDLTMVDANVAAGVQMTVDGAKLRVAEHFRFDGSQESNGSFKVFGGLVDDTIIGSQNGDFIQGNGGLDTLTGGGGADIFRYLVTSDSTTGSVDRILDFAPGTDKIDLTRIDADTTAAGDQAFHWIGSNAFGATGAASAGELRGYQNGGSWFVEGDVNGDGTADLVIELVLQGPIPLGAGDFLP